MKPTAALAVPTLMLAVSLVACSEDKAAVCTSVDDLKSSVQKVKDVDVTSSTGLSDLQSSLQSVEDDLANVKSDAKSEFDAQINKVESSYGALKTSAEAAKADPSAATVTAVRTALTTFGADAQTLVGDVQSTC